MADQHGFADHPEEATDFLAGDPNGVWSRESSAFRVERATQHRGQADAASGGSAREEG
jgi:hypothetical protein